MIGMSQEATLKEICDIVKKYRIEGTNPVVQEWYQRLKLKDDQTISNLQDYIKRKKIAG
jgi:hypothetical protein